MEKGASSKNVYIMDFYNKYYEGVFWLPSNEEDKIFGTLFIDENGISTISSLQSLCIKNDDPFTNRFPKFNVVYGWINKNESSETFSIKLYDARQNHQGISYLNKFKYVSHNSYISKGGDDKINVEKYNCLLLNSVYIDKWVNKTGFENDLCQKEKNEISQVYKLPDPIELYKNDEFKISLQFRISSTPTSLSNRKSLLKEELFVKVEFNKRFNIKGIVKFKNEIEWLFNLLNYQKFYFENVEIITVSKRNYISISKPKELVNQLKRGVNFDLVLPNSQKIFNLWFSKKLKFELYLKNFFSVYGQRGVMVENRFLTYVSIIESYHKKNLTLLETLPVLKRYKMKETYNHYKEPSLHQSLIYMFHKSSIFSNKKGLKKYTERIRDTRDFHIHILNSKEENSMNFEGINSSNELLENIILELFLKEIDIKGKTFRLVNLSEFLKNIK